MKAKHIVSAILIIILPFVIIFGFGALSDFFNQMASRTFQFAYKIAGMITSVVPIVAYIFWLSFVMRTKHPKTRILLSICSLAVSAILIACLIAPFILSFPFTFYFITTTTLICILANLFAGFYMLVKGKKYEEN